MPLFLAFFVTAIVGGLVIILKRTIYTPVVDSPDASPEEYATPAAILSTVVTEVIATAEEIVPQSIIPEVIPVMINDSTGEIVSAINPSATAQDSLKKKEGLSLTPYADPRGQKKTFSIGYGYQLRGGEWYPSISLDFAQSLFEKVRNEIIVVINKNVTVPLNQNQYDALYLFIYNVGQAGFRRSTLLKKLNAGNYQGAADEMLRWNKSNGAVDMALVARRANDRALFLA